MYWYYLEHCWWILFYSVLVQVEFIGWKAKSASLHVEGVNSSTVHLQGAIFDTWNSLIFVVILNQVFSISYRWSWTCAWETVLKTQHAATAPCFVVTRTDTHLSWWHYSYISFGTISYGKTLLTELILHYEKLISSNTIVWR